MHKFFRLSATLFSVFFCASLAQAALLFELPDAPVDSYVLDQADLLSPAAEAQLNALFLTVEAANSAEVVVVTVNSLEGRSIEEYTLELGREWGVGQNEFNNGLIVLVAPNERESRIEVGYGLEGAIPDATASLITSNILIPAFQSGDYEGGILEAAEALSALAKGEYFDLDSLSPSGLEKLATLANLSPIFIFIFWFFASWLSSTKSWWLGGVAGFVIGLIIGTPFAFANMLIFALSAGLFGLSLDYLLSKYLYGKLNTQIGMGGGSGSGSGGSSGGSSDGGFGGGSFGGGGSSGRW